MLNNRVLSQLEQVFTSLSSSVMLLDEAGNSLIPAEDIRFSLPDLPAPGKPVNHEGRLYQRCASSPDAVLMTPEQDSAAIRDAFFLADSMIGAIIRAESVSSDINSAWQRILENRLTAAELSASADEYRLSFKGERCVLLIHLVQVQRSNGLEIMEEVTPMGPNDVLVAMDRHTVALVKDTAGMDGLEDVREFAEALEETLMGETAIDLTVGIGDIVDSLEEVHSSYRQARRAIDIGSRYAPKSHIHVYRSMHLERFLSELNPETAAHYHALLFNRSTARLFSEEMLNTIDMFFKKDLNLSDTARQLYIHRNTLVYRLDKVQRLVGLDLRKFDDAVTFKLLYDMRKCVSNGKKIH